MDAFLLASFGCHVTMVERNPILWALLADAMRRARSGSSDRPSEQQQQLQQSSKAVADAASRLSLRHGDSADALAALRGEPSLFALVLVHLSLHFVIRNVRFCSGRPESERPHVVYIDAFYPLQQKQRPASSSGGTAAVAAGAATAGSGQDAKADEDAAMMSVEKRGASKKRIAFAKHLNALAIERSAGPGHASAASAGDQPTVSRPADAQQPQPQQALAASVHATNVREMQRLVLLAREVALSRSHHSFASVCDMLNPPRASVHASFALPHVLCAVCD